LLVARQLIALALDLSSEPNAFIYQPLERAWGAWSHAQSLGGRSPPVMGNSYRFAMSGNKKPRKQCGVFWNRDVTPEFQLVPRGDSARKSSH